MIRAAIFDIDDTLFDTTSKRFVPSAIDGLKQLQEEGVLVVLATGRPPLSAQAIQKEGITPNYIVCANGHITLDAQGKIIAEHAFAQTLSEEVYQYCKANEIGLLWKYPKKVYEYIHAEIFENFYSKTKGSRKNLILGKTDIHLLKNPNGGCLGCSLEKLELFNEKFAGKCIAVRIDAQSSDLMLYGVNKKSATAALMDRLNITGNECIAFGDNMNDMEILQYAGIGVCMGNGCEELKQRADYVTADLWHDGIRCALQKFRLLP